MISYYILCITTQFDNFTELFCFYKYMIENLITNVVRCRQLPRKRRQTKKTTQTTQMDIQGDFNLFINNLNTGSPSYQKGCFFLETAFKASSVYFPGQLCPCYVIFNSSRYSSRIKVDSPPPSRASGRLSRCRISGGFS